MFEHYFSLGFKCMVAVSLKKWGLRDTSGPFDWYVTNLDKLIACIENQFSGILLSENIMKRNWRIFIDRAYGFIYYHELVPGQNLEEQLPQIREKYLRRIDRFYQYINEPTCFVRAVQDSKEILYINKNYEYISSVFKRYNKENEIVYIIPREFLDEEIKIQFPMSYIIPQYFDSDVKTGKLIEYNEDLKKYLLEHSTKRENKVQA